MTPIEDAETPILLRVTYPIARKQYYCCECGREIAVGDWYESARGLWTGHNRFRGYRTCRMCVAVRKWAAAEHGVSACLGELREALEEAGLMQKADALCEDLAWYVGWFANAVFWQGER